MLVHEIAGIAALFIVGAIIVQSFKPGSAASSVLGASFNGFAQDLSVMEGNAYTPQAG